jgi:ATPase subunit of ABC transporter with duplicated ATPase domains
MTATAPPQDSTVSKSKVGWSDDTKKNSEDSDENNNDNNDKEHDSERNKKTRITGKIRNAFGIRNAPSENRNAGHVFVEFVQTKPKKRTKISCNNNKARGNVKIILHKFKADFPEGCVTALMGPSGAGML